MWALTVKYPLQILRGSALGTLVGALPGAGADIAAWMSYAMSKKFSKEPRSSAPATSRASSKRIGEQQRAGRRVDPGAGVRHSGRLDHRDRDRRALHEEHEPGPSLFTNNPQNIYAVYLLFIIANLIMIPLGWMCIKVEADPAGAAHVLMP
jgi:hypothetical protein